MNNGQSDNRTNNRFNQHKNDPVCQNAYKNENNHLETQHRHPTFKTNKNIPVLRIENSSDSEPNSHHQFRASGNVTFNPTPNFSRNSNQFKDIGFPNACHQQGLASNSNSNSGEEEYTYKTNEQDPGYNKLQNQHSSSQPTTPNHQGRDDQNLKYPKYDPHKDHKLSQNNGNSNPAKEGLTPPVLQREPISFKKRTQQAPTDPNQPNESEDFYTTGTQLKEIYNSYFPNQSNQNKNNDDDQPTDSQKLEVEDYQFLQDKIQNLGEDKFFYLSENVYSENGDKALTIVYDKEIKHFEGYEDGDAGSQDTRANIEQPYNNNMDEYIRKYPDDEENIQGGLAVDAGLVKNLSEVAWPDHENEQEQDHRDDFHNNQIFDHQKNQLSGDIAEEMNYGHNYQGPGQIHFNDKIPKPGFPETQNDKFKEHENRDDNLLFPKSNIRVKYRHRSEDSRRETLPSDTRNLVSPPNNTPAAMSEMSFPESHKRMKSKNNEDLSSITQNPKSTFGRNTSGSSEANLQHSNNTKQNSDPRDNSENGDLFADQNDESTGNNTGQDYEGFSLDKYEPLSSDLSTITRERRTSQNPTTSNAEISPSRVPLKDKLERGISDEGQQLLPGESQVQKVIKSEKCINTFNRKSEHRRKTLTTGDLDIQENVIPNYKINFTNAFDQVKPHTATKSNPEDKQGKFTPQSSKHDRIDPKLRAKKKTPLISEELLYNKAEWTKKQNNAPQIKEINKPLFSPDLIKENSKIVFSFGHPENDEKICLNNIKKINNFDPENYSNWKRVVNSVGKVISNRVSVESSKIVEKLIDQVTSPSEQDLLKRRHQNLFKKKTTQSEEGLSDVDQNENEKNRNKETREHKDSQKEIDFTNENSPQSDTDCFELKILGGRTPKRISEYQAKEIKPEKKNKNLKDRVPATSNSKPMESPPVNLECREKIDNLSDPPMTYSDPSSNPQISKPDKPVLISNIPKRQNQNPKIVHSPRPVLRPTIGLLSNPMLETVSSNRINSEPSRIPIKTKLQSLPNPTPISNHDSNTHNSRPDSESISNPRQSKESLEIYESGGYFRESVKPTPISRVVFKIWKRYNYNNIEGASIKIRNKGKSLNELESPYYYSSSNGSGQSSIEKSQTNHARMSDVDPINIPDFSQQHQTGISKQSNLNSNDTMPRYYEQQYSHDTRAPQSQRSDATYIKRSGISPMPRNLSSKIDKYRSSFSLSNRHNYKKLNAQSRQDSYPRNDNISQSQSGLKKNFKKRRPRTKISINIPERELIDLVKNDSISGAQSSHGSNVLINSDLIFGAANLLLRKGIQIKTSFAPSERHLSQKQ